MVVVLEVMLVDRVHPVVAAAELVGPEFTLLLHTL
jgi:hypothetical protein